MRKKSFLLLICCLLLLLTIGCGDKGQHPEPQPTDQEVKQTETDDSEKPLTPEEELEAWVENSKALFLAQTRKLDGKQYVLVTYGEKEVDGYEVVITETKVKEDLVEVHVKFSEPAADQVVNDAVDYPYVLQEIEVTELPVTFIAAGAEQDVPKLVGIDYLKPIVAGSEKIKIFTPAPDAGVSHEFTVEGIVSLDEGNGAEQNKVQVPLRAVQAEK